MGALTVTISNQWGNSYGQGTTFTSITSALQSCVVPLTAGFSVGGGSGTPTAGNWLFTIASWTQTPAIAEVHVGVGDDIHGYWREAPASNVAGNTRTSIAYTANTARAAGRVYVAPDGQVAAMNVLVVEVAGLGPWDTVTGTNGNYGAAAASLALALGAPPAASFFLAGVSGDSTAGTITFTPSGYTALHSLSQTNGTNHLADNQLKAAYIASSSSSQSISASSSPAQDMSGFLIGIRINAASPIPATQNPNWPYLKFEAGFGSGFNTPDSEVTWTDLTSRLWNWDETTGVQYQLGELQATNLLVQADNNDGALISTNTASPYYPNVVPGTPLRIRAALGTIGGTTVNRWYVIQRNAAEWGEAIDDQHRRYSDMTGTDLWAALSTAPPTLYRTEVREDGPYAWWPCDDQPGNAGVQPTALLNAAAGNTNTLNVTLSPNGSTAQDGYDTDGNSVTTVGTAIPPGIAIYTSGASSGWMFGDPVSSPASFATGNPESSQPGSAAWQQTGQQGDSGDTGWYLICHDTSFPPLSGGITVEAWFNYAYFGSANGLQPAGQSGYASLCQQPYSNVTLLELAGASNPCAVLQLNRDSGNLSLITYASTTPTSHSIYTSSDLRMGSWFSVTMTLTTTTWNVQVNGGATANVSGTAAGMTSAWTYLIANGDFGTAGGGTPTAYAHGGNVQVSHIAVYPYILPYYRIMSHYFAAVTAFGQIPAPTEVAPSWVGPTVPGAHFAPDGSINSGSYSTTTLAASAVAVGTVGSFTSGPSARGVGTAYSGSGGNTYLLWVGLAGLAASFQVYTATGAGSETEASITMGGGDSYSSGFGGSGSGAGVAHTGGGSGASPPTTGSSIGDTVGERIERLMGGGAVTSPNRCIDQAPLLVQAPGSTGVGTQTGQAIEAIQQSDSGLLFIDNCGNLTYWERPHLAGQYSSPVWSLGPTTSVSGRIPYYKQIRWLADPQHIINVITIAPLSPTGAALPLITPSNASAANTSQIAGRGPAAAGH